MKQFIAMFVMVLALLAGTAFAQNGAFAPYVTGTVTSAPGNNNPSFNVGGGVESSTNHFLFDVNGMFNTANSSVGAGYTGTITGSGYYKAFSHILIGGGASVVVNTNGFTAKNFVNTARQSANPFVGGGFQVKKLRLIATYQLPGKDALPDQRTVKLQSEYFASKHFRVVTSVTANSYINGAATRVTVAQLGGGLKFVF